MAAQSNVDTECLLLSEFVDDAGGSKGQGAEAGVAPALRELVRRIAAQTGVPRFKLDEVTERVLAMTAVELEERLREQIRVVTREYVPDSMPKPDTKPTGERGSQQASALPA
jgi:hypothetical protein